MYLHPNVLRQQVEDARRTTIITRFEELIADVLREASSGKIATIACECYELWASMQCVEPEQLCRGLISILREYEQNDRYARASQWLRMAAAFVAVVHYSVENGFHTEEQGNSWLSNVGLADLKVLRAGFIPEVRARRGPYKIKQTDAKLYI